MWAFFMCIATINYSQYFSTPYCQDLPIPVIFTTFTLLNSFLHDLKDSDRCRAGYF